MAIHVEVQAELDKRSANQTASELATMMDAAGATAGQRLTASMGASMQRDSPKIQKAFNALANAADGVTRAERAVTAAVDEAGRALKSHQSIMASAESTLKQREAATARVTRSVEALTRADENYARSLRTQSDAHRGAASSIQSHVDGINRVEEAARKAASTTMDWTDTLSQWGRTASYAFRGGAIIGAPVIIMNVVGAIGALAGAIGPLTGVLGSTVVGVESLKFATQGFGQAMKDIRDTQKFNEDLRKLAPSAQAAAIEIRNLLPMIDNIQQESQNVLFAGWDETLKSLADGLGPALRSTTVGVSQSFNQMFKDVGAELLSPGTSASITGFLDNTVASFRALEPAVRPAISAITNFLDVGSSFGPGLAATVAELAQEFSTFIQEARDDGSLSRWMERGIEAASKLIGVVDDVAKTFDALGDRGMSAIDEMVTGIELLSSTVRILTGDLGAFKDMIPGIGDLVADFWNKFFSPVNVGIRSINFLIDGMNSLGANIKKIPEIPHLEFDPSGPSGIHPMGPKPGGGSSGTQLNPGDPGYQAPGSPGYTGVPITPGHGLPLPFGTGAGTYLNGPTNYIQGKSRSGFGNPNLAPTGINAPPKPPKPSDSDRRAALIAGLDPSQWRVEPGAMPQGGPGATADPQGFIDAQRKVFSEAHDLEEARKMRLALEKDNTATQKEIDDAKWKEIEAGWSFQKSQADLVDKARGTAKDLKAGMDQLGAALDPDLGLGKGLSGMAENLVKFLGNLIAAPELAKLQATVNGDPIKGGFGLLGIRGAQNMAAGLSPLLGQPMPGGAGGLAGLAGGATGYGYGAGYAPTAGAGGGGYGATGLPAGFALPTGTSPTGRPIYNGPHTEDLKGAVTPNVANAEAVIKSMFPGVSINNDTRKPDGFNEHSSGEAIDFSINPGGAMGVKTPEGQAQGDALNQFLLTHAKELGLDYTIWQGQNQNPDGSKSANQGAGITGGHWDHVHGRFAPGDPAMAAPGGPTGATTGGPTAPSGYGGADWNAIAQGESGGNWQTNTGNGYYGGLQFKQSTWDAYKPQGAPERADQASVDQQKAAAEATLAAQGPGAWPNTFVPAAPGGGGLPFPAPNAGGGGQGPVFSPPLGPGGWGGGDAGSGGFWNGGGAGGTPNGKTGPSVGAGTGPGSGLVGGSGATAIGGLAPGGVPGGGGPGGVGMTPGGSLDTALGLATTAADLFAPGAGQAAQIGIKEANRAIQYAGQAAAIGVEGIEQTVLPTGGSELAQNSWLTRIVGGLASATPALPNIAGGAKGAADQQNKGDTPPLTPEQAAAQAATNNTNSGNTTNISVQSDKDRSGQGIANDISANQAASNGAAGGGMGRPR